MSAKTMASSGQWTIPSDPGQRLQRGGVEAARSLPRVKPEAAVIAKANVDGSIAMVFQQYPAVPKRPASERRAPPRDHERENVERLRKMQAENRAKQQQQQQQQQQAAVKADGRRGPMKAVHRPAGSQDVVDGSLVVTGSQTQQKHRHHRPRTQPAADIERPPSCHACGQYIRERERVRRPADVPVLDIPSASDSEQPRRHHAARGHQKPRQEPRRQDEAPKAARRPRSASLDRRPATAAPTAAAARSVDAGGYDRGRPRRPASAAAAKRDASCDEPMAPRRRGSLGGRGGSSGRDFVAENVQRLADQPRGGVHRSSSLSLGQLSVTGCRQQAAPASSDSRRKGELPAYLVKRREQWRRDEAERFARQPDPNCPPGHVVMKTDERLSTLQQLESRHDRMFKEMQSMPVRTDTLRMKNRKTELEQSLREVEDALKIFSRPTVYVKQDD